MSRRLLFGDLFKANLYVPKSLALFDQHTIREDMTTWLDPAFVAAVRDGSEAALKGIIQEHMPGVYSFPCFKHEFCDMLLGEIEHAQEQSTELGLDRPNGMNRYGIVLNQIGLEPLATHLQQVYVQPVARALFPTEGASLDDHHTFVVRYKASEDTGLDMHEDDSDVTLNVCLGREFEAATLTFCHPITDEKHRTHGVKYAHMKGHAVIHAGRHRHGADDIAGGERVNFLLWSLNSAYRATPTFKEDRTRARDPEQPSKVCLSYTHDADYEQHLARPSDTAAERRGVMLHQVKRRELAAQIKVQNLSTPNDAINTGPCLCLFLEDCPPESKAQLASQLMTLAQEQAADHELGSTVGDQRPLAFFAAVMPSGAVPHVRQLCGLVEGGVNQDAMQIGSATAVILDIPNSECYVSPQSATMDDSTMAHLIQDWRKGALKGQALT